MNTVPVVEVCANCGAPLDLDEASTCRWCHARVRLQRVTALAPLFSDQLNLVPDEVDGCASAAPFLYLALSSLEMLGVQPAVKEHMGQEPWLLEQIRALSTAVSAAGVRVRDGGLLKDSFDVSLGVYPPEEIWTFDLAFDVIAWVGTLDGLTGEVRALGADNVRSLAWYSDMHHWKRAMKKAGAGPATWHELRARMPHRGHPGKRLLEVALGLLEVARVYSRSPWVYSRSTASACGARIRHASVTSSASRPESTSASLSMTSGQPS